VEANLRGRRRVSEEFGNCDISLLYIWHCFRQKSRSENSLYGVELRLSITSRQAHYCGFPIFWACLRSDQPFADIFGASSIISIFLSSSLVMSFIRGPVYVKYSDNSSLQLVHVDRHSSCLHTKICSVFWFLLITHSDRVNPSLVCRRHFDYIVHFVAILSPVTDRQNIQMV